MTTRPLATPARPARPRAALLGWALVAPFAAFMLGASVLPKFAVTAMVADGMAGLGWPGAPVRLIGAMEAAFTLLVPWPRTAPLGAVAMTGLRGGAIAINLRAGTPLLGHGLFGTDLGAVMWAGVLLRDTRARPPALARLTALGPRPAPP